MPPQVEQLIKQAKEFYGKLNQQQRIFLFAGGALVFFGIIGFLLISSRPENVVLFSNLSRSDSQMITQRLDNEKVSYRLSKDGSAIMVPKTDVDKLRVQLAQEGLPSSQGVGLEYLDKPSLYDTDPILKAKYLRAQQTELSRTISQMDGVAWARVHLVEPKDSVFVEKEKDPTAAVELQLNPGTQLNSGQVRAIVALVSRSVEGLKPENVSIVDTGGNLLSDMITKEETPEKLNISQLEIQQKFEKELQSKLQNLLDNTLGLTQDGFHKAFVQVKAQLDFDNTIIDQTMYIPTTPDGRGIVRSQESTKEYLQGQKQTPGGVAGITSNVPGYPASNQGPMRYSKEQAVVNVEISSKKEHIKPPIGVNTKELHIAVAVDAGIAPADIQRIKNLVQSEAGINQSRGDTIAVEPLQFDQSYRKKMQQELDHEATQAKLGNLFVHFVLPFLLMVLLTGAAVYALMQRNKKAEHALVGANLPPANIPEEFFAPPPPAASEEKSADRDGLEDRKKMIEMLKQKGEGSALLMEEVRDFLTANPQAAADLIRSWLVEREGAPNA